MEILNHFFLNYFSLITVIGLIIWLSTFLFLIKIPNKSKAAIQLLLVSISTIIYNFGYFLSHSLYIPSNFPRVISLISVLFLHNFYLQFILHFPTLKFPKLAKFSFYSNLGISIGLSIYLIIYLLNPMPVIFDYSGHYYEIGNKVLYKQILLYLLTIDFINLVLLFWNIFKSKDSERKAYSLVLLAILCITILPAILSIINRYGFINREDFIVALSIIGFFGVFILLITFVNYTNDKTSFLTKIISISFIILFYVYTLVLNFMIRDRENSFDLIHQNKLESILFLKSKTDDLKFIKQFNFKESLFSTDYLSEDISLDENIIKTEN
ncbi:MAG: hypothetical protein KDK36_04565, partial [Leptospiraceae bacterium]|nr:hypothetical protein [Leptospiraceae bacterium]